MGITEDLTEQTDAQEGRLVSFAHQHNFQMCSLPTGKRSKGSRAVFRGWQWGSTCSNVVVTRKQVRMCCVYTTTTQLPKEKSKAVKSIEILIV